MDLERKIIVEVRDTTFYSATFSVEELAGEMEIDPEELYGMIESGEDLAVHDWVAEHYSEWDSSADASYEIETLSFE